MDVVIATNNMRTYSAIKQAINLVAQEKHLSPEWVNDDVTLIIDQVGRPRDPQVWRIFASLTVYIPELQYILALKLFAGRTEDDRDIYPLARQLNVHTKAQAWPLVHAYIPQIQLDMRKDNTSLAIGRCFSN